MIYSICETAKENGLVPGKYVRFLLETLPGLPMSKLEDALPWGSLVPDDVKRVD